MKKLFNLSPALKAELTRKGPITLFLEALGCIAMFGLVFGLLFIAHAIESINLAGGY